MAPESDLLSTLNKTHLRKTYDSTQEKFESELKEEMGGFFEGMHPINTLTQAEKE